MKDLETNKIVSAIILAGLIALVTGKIADGLYHPVEEPEKRGFQVAIAEASEAGGESAEASDQPIDIAALMAAADAAAGEKVFKKCAACHDASKDGKNKVGPLLYGVVGANKGHRTDYAYSKAILEKGGKWELEDLFTFLKKPQGYVPGSKMTFAGLKNPKDVADVVAFLKSQ